MLRAATTLLLIAALVPGAEARAQSPERGTENQPREEGRSHWQPHWPRFHPLEGIAMILAEGAAIAIYFAEPNRSPSWRDPLPLDSETRGAFRLATWEDEQTAAHVSDALFWPMLAYPIAVDAVLLAGIVHGDWDTALQMTLIDTEALAFAHFVTWLTTRIAGRVRPRALQCTVDDTCVDRGVGPVASFVSGHSLMAYTASGLICSHHITHPWLTGSVEGAGTACAAGLALATAIGVLRVMSDYHWASDVAIGAVIGSAIGWGVPFAFHYGRVRPTVDDAGRIAIVPGGAGDVGLGVVGAF